jgi:hypothetical protein
MEKPALVVSDLKTGVQKGQVALAVLTGATYFSNFEIRTTPTLSTNDVCRRCLPEPDEVGAHLPLRCAAT